MEKIQGKKTINGTVKYKIKWENYTESTWEVAENIPLIFRNYFDKTGNENILEPRIKHTKKIGNAVYHLLSWDNEHTYWENEEAFSLKGFSNKETQSQINDFRCQTQKASLLVVILVELSFYSRNYIGQVILIEFERQDILLFLSYLIQREFCKYMHYFVSS